MGRPESLEAQTVSETCHVDGQAGRDWNSHVGWDAQALDGSDLIEELGDRVLIDIEGEVADEEGVALGANNVTVLASTLSSAGGRSRVSVGLAGEVETHVAALELGAVLLIVGLLGVLRSVEVDVTEAAGAARVLVGDDASALDTRAVLELLVQSIVVDAPAEVADPEGGALLRGLALRLVLLGRGSGGLRLLIGLPLLGLLLGDSGLLIGGLRLLLRLGVRLRLRRVIGARLLVGIGLVRARLAGLVLRLRRVS